MFPLDAYLIGILYLYRDNYHMYEKNEIGHLLYTKNCIEMLKWN